MRTQSFAGLDLLLAILSCCARTPTCRSCSSWCSASSLRASPPSSVSPSTIDELHDDLSLRAIYSAADLLVVPSRQDNLPNTGVEAHASCTPVVALSVGVLPDIVDHQRTGYLAQPFEPNDLAADIRWVLADPARRQALGNAARERAVQLWNPTRVAGLYAEVFRQAIERV